MIITRYFYREILNSIAALLLVLILIYLSHRFIMFLNEAGKGNLPVEYIAQLLALKVLWALILLIPLTTFLAVLLTLGRLYNDSEMAAMFACGVGIPWILRRVVVLALLLAIPVSAISLFVAPWSRQQEGHIRYEIRQLSDIAGLAAGRFQSFDDGRGVFYIESYNKQHQAMHNVFVSLDRGNKNILLTSEKAYPLLEEESQAHYIVMFNGYRYDLLPGTAQARLTHFDQHAVLINPPPVEQNYDFRAAATHVLLSTDHPKAMAELQSRLSAPLTLLLLAILAVLMSHTAPRQGRYAKIFSAILIYFIYNNLQEVSRKWVEQEILPTWIGIWWVHAAMLLVISALWLRHKKRIH
ncbi:LPS export ABC transporter permease LptF [Candidatus Venteria ishoeyi]|uniref:LPS export ABC transporter permease LptF n=1 Tax=Candidatus Venteria ishoeyi TaxID=1899563 RepID=UPI0025A51009|nr:LPS export ABC transporter permease LptF [Candidatus Venteria ishoeyi]MDM8546851.1 LPS export ABC transporter permease LptF [Candidatus Venteria ishoeyi]